MFKLDNDFLQSLGLGGLPVEEKNKLLQMIYERLEMNVGMRLAEKMSDQQLDEFEGFIDRNDEAGALKWLETNFPNYKDVVAEELEKLKNEVQTATPQILAAHSGGGQQMPPIAQAPIMPGVPQQTPLQPDQMPQQPGYQQTPPQYAPAPPQQNPYQNQTPVPQPQMAPQQPTQPPMPATPNPGFMSPQQEPYQNPQPAPAPQPYYGAQGQPIEPAQGGQPFGPAPASPQPSQPPPVPQQPEPQLPPASGPPQGGFTPPPPGYIPGQ